MIPKNHRSHLENMETEDLFKFINYMNNPIVGHFAKIIRLFDMVLQLKIGIEEFDFVIYMLLKAQDSLQQVQSIPKELMYVSPSMNKNLICKCFYDPNLIHIAFVRDSPNTRIFFNVKNTIKKGEEDKVLGNYLFNLRKSVEPYHFYGFLINNACFIQDENKYAKHCICSRVYCINCLTEVLKRSEKLGNGFLKVECGCFVSSLKKVIMIVKN